MRLFFERRYSRFQKVVDTTLAEYYGIKNATIVERKLENGLYITIRYEKKYPIINFYLPFEINKLIHSYMGDFIEIQTTLICPKLYPYISPVWNLEKVNHNIDMDLEEYYRYIVEMTNESNIVRKNWSSIYGFEKEILRFFIRINHFELI